MSRLRTWLPVIIWTTVILSASSPRFSAGQTADWLARIVGHPIPQTINVTLRKLGHITAYGILGALAFRAAAHTTAIVEWSRRNAAIAIAIAFAVAAFDEWNQSHIPTRTGTAWDVLLDVSAAIGAVVVVAVLARRLRRQIEN